VVLTAGWQPVRIRARNMMVWTFGMRLWLVLAIATLLPPASFAAETPAAHGAYLATTIMACNNCHTPRGPNADLAFSGGQTFDTPDYTVVASNITPDVKTGIGGWSDAQLEKTLRTGVRPDGVALAPVMPSGYYGIISDADMAAIIAYLRTIPAIERQVPAPIYRKAEPIEIFPGAEHPTQDAGGTDPLRRGRYLATIGHCLECHMPIDAGHHDFDRAGAGGQLFRGPWGVVASANITSDPDQGLGQWTDQEIKRAITQGVARDGSKLKPPMAYANYARMTQPDLDALVAWLRTVPPKS
jgi:mono/diheme cytochrome c family protein